MKKFYLILCLVVLSKFSIAQINRNFTFETLNRTFVVYLPTGYSASTPLPVVFVLHGFTQTAAGIMAYSNFNAIANAGNFIVVYPNGTGLLQSWNSNSGASGVNDFGFINALLDTMIADYAVQTQRVFACGFSNGGFMSHRLACESNRFAAIASVSGTMQDGTFTACNPTKKIPVLQIHGTSDAVVNYNGTAGTNRSVDETVDFWKQNNTCSMVGGINALPNINADGTTVDSIAYAPCANNVEVQLLKINSGGHQWPSAIGNSGLGTTCTDINASQRIWDFFNKNANPNSIHNVQIQSNRLQIFPNPSQGIINVNYYATNGGVTQILISDMLGKVVLRQTVSLSTGYQRFDLDCINLKKGMYILSFDEVKHKLVIE